MTNDPPLPNARRSNELSRRDLGRYAAVSAVAAAICGKAASQGQAQAPIASASSDPCELFLGLLRPTSGNTPGTTIADILYKPLFLLVELLRTSAATNYPVLAAGLVPLENHLRNHPLPARLLFTHDSSALPSDPLAGTDINHWRTTFHLCRDPRITSHFAFPFLGLSARNTDGRREAIELLLTDQQVDFQNKVGHIVYLDLFDKNRKVVFGAEPPLPVPPGNTTMKENWVKYGLVRTAFKLGVFEDLSKHMSLHGANELAANELRMTVIPNNQCYSESQGVCVYMYGGFCKIDNGHPTSSSTTCA